MVDTEGSEVHTSELEHPIKAEVRERRCPLQQPLSTLPEDSPGLNWTPV